jgi:hypothetical protein
MSNELLKLFQRVKKVGRKHFLKEGEVLPRFFLEFEHVNSTSNSPATFIEVCCPWASQKEKYLMMSQLKERINVHGRLLRYCFISEVWMAPPDAKERPSLSADRTEHLQIVAEERNAPLLFGLYEIKRDLSGRASLGKWEEMTGARMSGPFSNILGEPNNVVH